MASPAANAIAQARLTGKANLFMGQTFEALAASIRATMGPAFDAEAFVARVGNVQINRIKASNDNGESTNDLVQIAEGGTFQDAEFQFVAPSDRFRILLGFKLTVVSKTDATAAIGDQNVPAGAMQQLAALGLLRMDRRTGRSMQGSLWEFVTGSDNRRFVPSDDAAVALNRIPSEQEILPWGLGVALASPIDALNPKDVSRYTINGLNGVAVAAAFANDLLVGVDAIVLDAIMSGQ